MPTGVKAVVDEDVAANLYAEGYSCRAISYQLHTSEERVAKVVKARFGDIRPRRYRKALVLLRCKRCMILLSEAPEGENGLCKYCVEEIVAPGWRSPGGDPTGARRNMAHDGDHSIAYEGGRCQA